MTPSSTQQHPAHSFYLTTQRTYSSPRLLSTQFRDTFNNRTSEVTPVLQRKKTHGSHLLYKIKHCSKDVKPVTTNSFSPLAIFLGGSCNPTTWRDEIAIPMLDAAHVHYFNPQVQEWYEELIEIETKAKESAQLILLVIDKLTRCLVSINEAVEAICRGRNVVLVVENIEEGDAIAGKVLTKTEVADLNGARQWLRDLARKKHVRMFSDVAAAVNGCIAWLRRTHAPTSRPEMPRLWKRSSIVLHEWCGKRQMLCTTSRSHSLQQLELNGTDSSIIITNDNEQGSNSPGLVSPTQSIMKQRDCQLFTNFTGAFVYLGGDLSATSWRENVAIPLLRKAGIPVYVPFIDYVHVGLPLAARQRLQTLDKHFQDIETQKAIAKLILFVIPRNVRSITAMVEAVELVSTHQALLLVIEPVEEGCMLEKGIAITGCEFKDLARARKYLREMAERNDVAVFESVTEAVESIIEMFD